MSPTKEQSSFGSLRLQTAQKPAYVIYERHDEEPKVASWKQVFETACSIADRIIVRDAPATTGVIITCNNELNFAASLLATWLSGATAIPTTNTMRRNLYDRNTHIYGHAEPDIVLHDLSKGRSLARLQEMAPKAKLIDVRETSVKHNPKKIQRIEGALLQYTSGSTSNPKPVLLNNHDIRSGCKAIAHAYELDEESTGIHWLPLYHDMGLIGSVVMPLWTGGTSVIMRPSAFIQEPSLWFKLATQWKARITAAPNFAYEYVLSKLESADHESVDLSSMVSMIIGGEPVQPATLRRLYAAAPRLGLLASAIKPSYGMAEATLLVSRYAGGHSKRVFSQRHSVEEITCVGEIVPQVEIEIRDNATNEPVDEGDLGDIWIFGEAVGRVIPTGDTWRKPPPKAPLNTGDIGFQEAGSLYIVARQSNLLIIRGANFYSEDIEAALLNTQPPGAITGIAAVSIKDSELGTDALYLFIEIQSRANLIPDAEINTVLGGTFGLRAHEVIQLRSRSLPRTSSGKVIRRMAKTLYIEGKLDRFRLKSANRE